jgi:hypothetical protein
MRIEPALIWVAAAALLSACGASSPAEAPVDAAAVTADTTAPAPAVGDCTDFVEIAAPGGRCGFALTAAGELLQEERSLAAPLVVSYEESAAGTTAIAAGKVVLFPPSPNGRFRVLQACEGAGADGMCWKVFVYDLGSARLSEAAAGKYGPERWISWSPDERHAALVSRNEGASWLHLVETASGRAVTVPDAAAGENWQIRPETFAWTGPRSFVVTAARCPGCPEAREGFSF